MQRYIAFLRAINVGGRNVKMEYLRTLFEALEFDCVETFIASGNVIFQSASEDKFALEQQIEAKLKQTLGYEVATFLRTPADLASIVALQPFSSTKGSIENGALSIGFLKTSLNEATRTKVVKFRSEIDDFYVGGREIYWSCRTKISESKFTGALLEKAIGMPSTMRNVTTVRKLAAKYAPEG